MKKRTRKSTSRKRPISAEDLYRLRLPTAVKLSPDEQYVAYTVERMDRDKKKYFTNIWMHDLSGGESRQFTFGDNNDRQVAWAPDGRSFAFVSTRDKKTGIYVMPVEGGAERRLAEIDGAIGSLQFHPDGGHLVFCLRYNDSHFIDDDEEKKKPPVYRHITRLQYKFDAQGFLPNDTFQVYSMALRDGVLKKITSGKRDNQSPDVSPDGKWIVYHSNRSKNPDVDSLRDDLFIIPFGGGKEKKIATPPGPIAVPKFSPDGKTIAYLGHDNPNDAWGVTNYHIWIVGVKGSPKARDLMPGWDRMAVDHSISDMGEFGESGAAAWSADGKRIYFTASDTGVTNLFYITRSAGKPTRIYRGDCHIKGFSINGKTRLAVCVRSDLTTPGDIITCPTNYGAEKKAKTITDLNRFIRDEIKLGRTRELMFSSFDGTKVQGFVVTPPDFKKTRKYPAVLQIHGGPRAQYAYTFFHEMQYLAAQGYVVFYTNPRGGTGRGETWAGSIAGGWGELDYKDCMAAADWLEKQKYVNTKRIGVTGGSYGGWMTNWMIGHTNRFRAAITQRSVVNLESMFGSSDIGWALEREFDGTPMNNPENYEKCSPLTYMKNVKTPVLIIHSEQDLRCPIEQAEQMFVTLKMLGKTCEMVRFPEEPHGLSRHGRPDRRIARLEWMLKWFDRYLKR
ncbi:prolyl oligopeptidase family serine peptidase [candidate division GN15 bacterium]|nr:prolyl oligopeptidase family serine peptidase [candidate division GN15 bacterium]